MLTALFLTLIALGLVLHYLLVERPRLRARQIEPALPSPLPLIEAMGGVPDDVFIQPTLTWVRLLEDGHLLLGLHPLLVSLVGSPYQLEVIPEGWEVGKGRPLLKIQRESRNLQVRSPVSGRIVEVNPNACMERGWTRPVLSEECWVYRVEPEGIFWDMASWLRGEEAREWVRKRFREVESFVSQARGGDPEDKNGRGESAPGVREEGSGEAGSGREALPVGILAELDAETWRRFEERFLVPPGARGKRQPSPSPRFSWTRRS